MASLQQFAHLLEKPTGIGFRTIKHHVENLRFEGLIAKSKNGNGATPATSGDVAKLLTSLVAAPLYSQAGATASRVLGLMPARAASEAYDNPHEAHDAYYAAMATVGVSRGGMLLQTLVGVLDALRSGAFDAAGPHDILVEFYNGGEAASVTLFPQGRRNSVHMTFGFSKGKPIDRITRIRGGVFRDLANLLGPLPAPAIPPPPS